MANSIRAAASRGARGLFVLAASFHAQQQPSHNGLVSAATTTTTTATSAGPEDCDGDAAIDVCQADAACSDCFSGWSAVTSASAAACEERFPDVTSLCEQDGADFCCNLGDEATVDACMSNELFVTFLGCFMEGFQCSIEDMPCFDGTVFTDAPSPSTPSPTTPSPTTPAPFDIQQSTASPSTPSSSAERGLPLTPSPSSSSAERGFLVTASPTSVGEEAISGSTSAVRLLATGRNVRGFGVLCVAFLLGLQVVTA